MLRLAWSLLLCASLLVAAPADLTNWENVTALAPGTTLQLRLQPGSSPEKRTKVKGKLLAATGTSLTLQLPGGATRTLERSTVRQVLATGGKRRRAPLIGAAAGAAAVGVLASRPRFDLVPSAVALAIAAGAAAGYGLGKGLQSTVVYQVP
jgi:hypothetical protein